MPTRFTVFYRVTSIDEHRFICVVAADRRDAERAARDAVSDPDPDSIVVTRVAKGWPEDKELEIDA